MNILSWNLNGLQSSLNRDDFKQFEALPQLDIICLQEIRTHSRCRVLENYNHFWYPAEKKRYSGTLTLTLVKPFDVRYGIGVDELDTEGRVITADMGSVYIVNTYVPNSCGSPERAEYRRKWDETYHRFLKDLSYDKPVIACGDYNVTLTRNDIFDENIRMNAAEQGYISDDRSSLQELLDSGFTDAFRYLYPDKKRDFTWWSNRRYKRNEDRGWRLDYFIVDDALRDNIVDVTHQHEITGSDHCPILLNIDIDDNEYEKNLAETIERNCRTEETNRKLTFMWNKRRPYFDRYEEKLKELQAEITVYSQLHMNDRVRELQNTIMDDIRFRCLAVNEVAANDAPPGVDDVRWKTNADKMKAAQDLDWRGYKASPKRIIEIKSKNSGKVRRTGILTYKDKAMSVLVGYTFSPIEEAYADRSSFAFRPGRSRQDAIIAVANLFAGENAPEYYVYLDIKGFYAALQHKWIMHHVPLNKQVLYSFLKAGHVFSGELFPSGESGISEGSPLSPAIANFTLDGMQKAIYDGIHGRHYNIDFRNGEMVRYADDVIVAVRSEEDFLTVRRAVREFLEPRGLVISEEKTTEGRIEDGINVIGFFIKKEFHDITIRPKDEAIAKFKTNIHDFITGFSGSRRELITKLNKKLKGWAGQYRCCDSYDSYRAIDSAVQASLLEAAVAKHPKLQEKKLIDRYWYTDRQGKTWYALEDDRSVCVIHLIDTLLIAPRRSKTDRNPYFDNHYFSEKKKNDDIDRINSKYKPIWERQDGKCLYCGNPLLPDQHKKIIPIDESRPQSIHNSAYIHAICMQDDYQFYYTLEDVGSLTEYDVREALERLSSNIEKPDDIPENWKYIKLYYWFARETRPHIILSFKQIEEILGFKLPKTYYTTINPWYPKNTGRKISETWILNGYEMTVLNLKTQKVTFQAKFEDAELVRIPPEIKNHKLPKRAKFELEHFMAAIIT